MKYTYIFLSFIYISPTMARISYLFSHGIADSGINQSKPYGAFAYDGNLHTFNYPDSYEGLLASPSVYKLSYRINRSETSFAQENEIKALYTAYNNLTQDSDGVVGIGVSRGASAFFTWLSHPEYTPDRLPIKALILESPFDSLDTLVKNLLGTYLYETPAIRSLTHQIIAFIFGKYRPDGPTPIGSITNFPQTIPVLIICSEKDSRVPAYSSENLYHALKNAGHQNVHFYKVPSGAHAKIISGNYKSEYLQVIHAFYHAYGLPHDPQLASLGHNRFNQTHTS